MSRSLTAATRAAVDVVAIRAETGDTSRQVHRYLHITLHQNTVIKHRLLLTETLLVNIQFLSTRWGKFPWKLSYYGGSLWYLMLVVDDKDFRFVNLSSDFEVFCPFRASPITVMVMYFVYSNGTALTSAEVEKMVSVPEYYPVLVDLGLRYIVSNKLNYYIINKLNTISVSSLYSLEGTLWKIKSSVGGKIRTRRKHTYKNVSLSQI